MLTVPAGRGIPSTLPENQCQLGVVSKYRHHPFPKAPHYPLSAIPAPSHSLWGRSLSRCQACLAPPSPALPFSPGQTQLCASPWPCTTLLTLCFPRKASPRAPSVSRGEFGAALVVCGWGFCVFGVSVCLSHPSSCRFLPASSPAQGNLPLCSLECPRGGILLQLPVKFWEQRCAGGSLET